MAKCMGLNGCVWYVDGGTADGILACFKVVCEKTWHVMSGAGALEYLCCAAQGGWGGGVGYRQRSVGSVQPQRGPAALAWVGNGQCYRTMQHRRIA